MSLLDRIAARRCRVKECQREAAQDAIVCYSHLADMWANRLRREPDGSFVFARSWTAKELAR